MWPYPLIAYIAVAVAQQDPIEDFCRRHQHQTCIIDNKLYIDGGKVFYGGSVENGSIAQQNLHLLWEDVLATDNETEFPQQYKNLTKTPEVPSVSGGVLWPDTTNKMFYLYGGEYNDAASVQPFENLWFFDTIYNTWNRTNPSASQSGIAWPAFGAGVVTEGGTAYYYGGYLSNKSTPNWSSSPLMLSSLITFDMDTQIWSNHTYDNTPRAEGVLQYLPASASGMLVYFGGVETVSNGRVQYANMSEIRVFDINENQWFTQSASGFVPSPRRGMCAGVAWADDRSSYNIYVQGGVREDGATFGETYILTIPSFQWTLIYPEPNELPHTATGKGWSSCNVVRGNSQMLIIGGAYGNKSYVQCDTPDYHGQHGLLLGQESVEVEPPKTQWWWRLWRDYNKYRVPDKIVSLVGGNTEGHATRTSPLQGWTTPSPLAPYFVNQNYEGPRTATRPIPGTPTPTASVQPGTTSSRGRNIGAIAGGTLGGLLFLIALLSATLIYLRRKRPKQPPHHHAELDTTTAKAELDGLQGSPANYTLSDGGTMIPSLSSTPAYSPQVSTPQGTHSWSEAPRYYHASSLHGEEGQRGGLESRQVGYPPPLDFSQAKYTHVVSAELPGVRSPVCAEAECPTDGEVEGGKKAGLSGRGGRASTSGD